MGHIRNKPYKQKLQSTHKSPEIHAESKNSGRPCSRVGGTSVRRFYGVLEAFSGISAVRNNWVMKQKGTTPLKKDSIGRRNQPYTAVKFLSK